jgi:hypothetical protein
MALKMQRDHANDMKTRYERIIGYSWADDVHTATVAQYINLENRRNDQVFQWTGYELPGTLDIETGVNLTSLYDALKTLPEFAGTEDC